MHSTTALALLGATLGLAAGPALAAEILVGDASPGQQPADLIAVDTTWTADNTYNLQDQIYVLPGATLTIEAGTVVASTPSANGSGSLAVTRGAQIFVNGTKENPVIMTSTDDVATWTGGDPNTGTWRQSALEWGNLTIMGDGLISASHFGGVPVVVNNNGTIRTNTAVPDGLNEKQMEGLVAAFPGDPKVLYGGDNDDDDSGSINYLSIRYGGRVVGLTNELNGLSLGGIGRETEISHVEIMNNVDDGIEIWGGTVELKYFNIWNIGDDSFDVDQGWRGKAQFGFVVQGYSLNSSQGSGVGDNCFETDGAEDSDAQPVTTAKIHNCTVIGQPFDGDGATTWRDNARVQYRNCVIMDIGDELVRFDNVDGDGAQGYGHNGTLSWLDTWATPYTATSLVNGAPGAVPGDFNHPGSLYQAQTDGFLAELSDSVFFNISDYADADAVGVTIAGDDNPAVNNVVSDTMPIVSITREMPVLVGGRVMQRVLTVDPRPVGDAVTSAASASDDGFFCPANFRGAFLPNNNWLLGWSAADAFGFIVEPTCTADFNGDGSVGFSDLNDVLGAWGACPGLCPADLNGDGNVGFVDLNLVLGAWGACP